MQPAYCMFFYLVYFFLYLISLFPLVFFSDSRAQRQGPRLFIQKHQSILYRFHLYFRVVWKLKAISAYFRQEVTRLAQQPFTLTPSCHLEQPTYVIFEFWTGFDVILFCALKCVFLNIVNNVQTDDVYLTILNSVMLLLQKNTLNMSLAFNKTSVFSNLFIILQYITNSLTVNVFILKMSLSQS